MSNTISVNGELVANQVIKSLSHTLAPIGAFSSDFSSTASQPGNSIAVGLVSAPVSGYIFAGSYVDNADSTISKVSVPLTHYYKSFFINDSEASSSAAAKLENLVDVNVTALGKNILANVFANATTGNFGGSVGVTAVGATGFSWSNAKTLRTALDTQGADIDQSALVLNSTAYTALLPTTAQNLDAATLANGSIPKVYGMGTYSTNTMPNTTIVTATTGKLVGFAAHKSAFAVASRLPACQNPDKLDVYKEIEIPGLGMSVAYREWYDLNAGRKVGAVETLFGSAVGFSGACKLISDN